MKLSPEKSNSIIRKNLFFTLFKCAVGLLATALTFAIPLGVTLVFGLSSGEQGAILGLCVLGLVVFLLEMVELDIEDCHQSFFAGLFCVLYYRFFEE